MAATDNPLLPYRVLDADGAVVVSVASFLKELLAASRPAAVAIVCDGLLGCGHRDISTTMGYKAIYSAEAIEAGSY